MGTRFFCRLGAVVLIAAAWGCELGGPDGTGEEATSGVAAVETTPETLAEAVLVPNPTPAVLAADGGTEEVETDGGTGIPPTAAADCIDFGTGTARLIPCTATRLSTTNWAGHDDPDPWRPAEVPANPY